MSTRLAGVRALVERRGGPSRSHRPGVVVLGAGKGGVGVSTSAALLALSAARAGREVLLVDADEHVGSLPLLLGFDGAVPGLGELGPGGRTPEELLLRPTAGLDLLPGGGGGAGATLSGSAAERRARFRRVSGLYDRYDLVVVDGGARLESVTAACAPGAERLLVATRPDRVALAGAYALLKVARERLPELPGELLVTGADDEAGRAVHEVALQAVRHFLGGDLSYAGAVPDDPAVEEAALSGRSLASIGEGAPAVSALSRLAERLRGEQETAAAGGPAVLPLAARG